jgi:hypothetical protein
VLLPSTGWWDGEVPVRDAINPGAAAPGRQAIGARKI